MFRRLVAFGGGPCVEHRSKGLFAVDLDRKLSRRFLRRCFRSMARRSCLVPLAQNIQSHLPQQAEAAPSDRVFAVDYKHLFGVAPVKLDL
jgi:hypothetical protein